MQARDERGRLVPVNCPDPNCGGVLVHEVMPAQHGYPAQHQWHCDGLTHERDDDELTACPRMIFGPIVRAIAA